MAWVAPPQHGEPPPRELAFATIASWLGLGMMLAALLFSLIG